MKNEPLPNEYRILIPAREIAHEEEHPEMMVREIASRVIQAIEEQMDFILVNIPAADVMAHTGNFNAAVAALEAIDRELMGILKTAEARGAALVITADHGNVEQMRDPKTGIPETGHNQNPVPVYIVAPEYKNRAGEKLSGTLADVAPTLCALMNVPAPQEMTGKNLLWNL